MTEESMPYRHSEPLVGEESINALECGFFAVAQNDIFSFPVILGLGRRIHINITIPTDNSVRTAVLPHWVSLCLNLKFVPQARFQIAIFSGLTRESKPYCHGYSQQVKSMTKKGNVILSGR